MKVAIILTLVFTALGIFLTPVSGVDAGSICFGIATGIGFGFALK